jgi:hypothetical protein
MATRRSDPIFSKDALRDLFHHMEWADEEIWRAVLPCHGACVDATIQGLLLHLHVVQRAFLAVWKGRALTYPDASESASIAELHAWTATYYAEARAYLEAVDEDALSRQVVMPWASELARSWDGSLSRRRWRKRWSRLPATRPTIAARSTRACARSAASRRWWTTSPGSGSAVPHRRRDTESDLWFVIPDL